MIRAAKLQEWEIHDLAPYNLIFFDDDTGRGCSATVKRLSPAPSYASPSSWFIGGGSDDFFYSISFTPFHTLSSSFEGHVWKRQRCIYAIPFKPRREGSTKLLQQGKEGEGKDAARKRSRRSVDIQDNSTTGNIFITTPPPSTTPPPQHPWNKLVQVRQSDNMRSFFLFFFFPAVFFFLFLSSYRRQSRRASLYVLFD